VKELVPNAKPFASLVEDVRSGRAAHVIALGGPTPRTDPEDATALGMIGALVVIASHEGALTDAAHVVLPATSWAEHAGTYVNKNGVRQVADKGLEPQGGSLPAWEHVRKLALALGLEPGWTKLKDLRALLTAQSVPSTPNVATTASAET
jgi:NADH dehydrogenase/NADH:ubiquinone oxidoreductase subunit G